ncbi:hypothetical protein Dda_4005 [Drechslerella dactyloides]|uniref:Phosphatidic acid phosphatase type 2/haloperoxidase domain-containing protein n=1 Tax=Drechslerella dactyloides TaxID=74499 RepID=A0AAD6IZE3_DREDA|nr:hypothetical protein Dda_4005 [Drechslerella dactyloides]
MLRDCGEDWRAGIDIVKVACLRGTRASKHQSKSRSPTTIRRPLSPALYPLSVGLGLLDPAKGRSKKEDTCSQVAVVSRIHETPAPPSWLYHPRVHDRSVDVDIANVRISIRYLVVTAAEAGSRSQQEYESYRRRFSRLNGEILAGNGVLTGQTFNQKTYAADYLGLVILAASNASLFVVEPFHKAFTIDDPRLQFPHAEHERVPVPLLLGLSIFIPVVAILGWTTLTGRNKHFLLVSLLGLSNSMLLCTFVTDFIKQGVGRPRPDLVSRCQPREDTPHDKLVTYEVCYQTDHHTLHDGFRSFPSGHSSTSFSGLFYLTLFLCGQFFVFRPGGDLTRTMLAFSSSFLAAYIAISRLEDYRHDYADVVVGSWIGIGSAYFSYRRYFPQLASIRCNEPYHVPPEGGSGVEYEGLKNMDDEEHVNSRRLSDIEMGMRDRV